MREPLLVKLAFRLLRWQVHLTILVLFATVWAFAYSQALQVSVNRGFPGWRSAIEYRPLCQPDQSWENLNTAD